LPHARVKDLGFLFVAPKVARVKQQHPFPYGMAYVSAMLRREGFRVSCLDMSFSDEPCEQQLKQRIERDAVDVVCTGGMSVDYHQINEVVALARKFDSRLLTVVGGAMVTCDPGLALEALNMDYGVMGEGEYIMLELAHALCNDGDPVEITGLIFKDAKGVVRNTGSRKSTKELDALPFPDYEAFEFARHLPLMKPNNTGFHQLDVVRMANIFTSRSCPFGCTFCYQQLGRVYRQRSMAHVFAEIDFLVKTYGINALDVADDLFSVNKERLLEFAVRIKPYGIKWTSQFRVKDADYEVLMVLRDAGLVRISYGIESVDDSILLSMKKKIKVKDIEHGLAETRRAGIAIQGNILFGDPAETEETFENSIEWWKRHPEYDLTLFNLLTIPDAPVYKQALQRGLIQDKMQFMKSRFPVINLTAMPDLRFKMMLSRIYRYQSDPRYKTRGTVLGSRNTGVDEFGTKLYEIELCCPECKAKSRYRNFHQNGPMQYFPVYCNHCNRRFYADTLRAFPNNFSAGEKLKFKMSYVLSAAYNRLSFLRYYVERLPFVAASLQRLKRYLIQAPALESQQ
jgi:radical SAM superfamily enzyme YgiQ (UPF0313 family)